MRFAALALAGAVAAHSDDAMNALKIRVSPHGQKKVEKEAHDIKKVAKKIKNAPATKKLGRSIKNWAHSPAAKRVRALDKKFLKSNDGKRLVKEWKDVGKVVKKHVQHKPHGLHIPNRHMKKVVKELDDVSDHYEYLGTTHWDRKYKMAYKKLFTSPAFNKVKKAGKQFKHSMAGKALKKEVMEFGGAVKKHVKVTDVPPKWRRAMRGLKIDVHDPEAIEAEFHDIPEAWEEIESSDVVQDVGAAFQRWGKTDEVHALEELDHEFAESEDGQELMEEWQEFGQALDDAIEPTDTGIHIHNSKMEDLEDEAEDIAKEYRYLKKTHWHDDYKEAFEEAFDTLEFHKLANALEKFHDSDERQILKKEVDEFFHTVENNVEVSDIPEHWQEDMEEEAEDWE